MADQARDAATYTAIEQAAAWQQGGYPRTKRIVAGLLRERVGEPDSPMRGLLEQVLESVEAMELDGESEPETLTDEDIWRNLFRLLEQAHTVQAFVVLATALTARGEPQSQRT